MAESKIIKENFAGVASVNAEGTAKYLQSFEEMAIMQEAPPATGGYVPRGKPRKGLSGDPTDGARSAADGATPKFLSERDDATNIRADNQILTRATPTSSKSERDKRPNKLRTYTDAAGEGL